MRHAKVLDCTLRDGAYLVDKKFGDNTIYGIINGLVKANIEFIEIGFLQDEGKGEGKTVFYNSEDAKKYVPKDKKNSMFTVLADYSRYSIENLDECTPDSFDAVRACFFKKERYQVIEFCKKIKEKGYKLFVQPVDILGYTDAELIEFLELINPIEPYALSIVDTFGSMYVDDLQRIFSLINHNLIETCHLGFHSHNNMQMSNALSQEFIKMSLGKRQVIVDATLSGMGRGAGNTPTELVVQYMVSQMGYTYDIDAVLDVIDDYMDNIRSRCSWGYSTSYFIAGCYSAHVNNISYLTRKNSIRSKDIRYILNKVGGQKRKRYDYDLLEKTYLEYVKADIDDSDSIALLKKHIEGKNVVLLAPGNTARKMQDEIGLYIKEKNAIVISVNFIHDVLKADYLFFSNNSRYEYWKNDTRFKDFNKIVTSNISADVRENDLYVSFANLIKCGWEHMDNAAILLLRLLDDCRLESLTIAGLDGYEYISMMDNNYVSNEMELSNVRENPYELNSEIQEMLYDYMATRKSEYPVTFFTPSRFKI